MARCPLRSSSDPDKGEVTDRIAPQDMRRLDSGEQMVVRASADRIEAITPIDRRAGIYLFTTRQF
jgi:two-component system nitrogen regulation sensor histidine kinase NtrY